MSSTSANRCKPKPGGRTVSLRVLPASAAPASTSDPIGHGKIQHSRAGKWRALALILVHVGIAAHILIWRYTGNTLSPVEPSESMSTLKSGAINAGFVFFALALLSTVLLGRWFCGWGCHIVALQDSCTWLMNKIGVRPKPFRARLLLWVPLALALYMFVWPVFHRVALRPLFMDQMGRLPVWLGQSDPIPGVTTEFIVRDFWATFAPWYIAIPFLLVCTFGVVYFLGSKGFCTYGCPYGGFFAPLDKFAPGKIRVTDACEGCGHCTAVCTSNVRVHEEVRDFGMVVDPGCMKCMDCVTVCPNDALYFGFGKPTFRAKPRNKAAARTAEQARALRAARYDLKWYEEVGVLAVFLAFFMCYRQMAHSVPMLMAVGMAGIMAYAVWRIWTFRPVRWGGDPNSRLQSLQLRLRGRLRPAGVLFLIGTILLTLVAAWSGLVRFTTWRGAMHYAKLATPLAVTLRPDFQPTSAERAAATAAIDAFTHAERLGNPHRAIGLSKDLWPLAPDDQLALSYSYLVVGNRRAAIDRMVGIIERGLPRDHLVFQTAQLLQSDGRKPEEIIALYRRALELHPELDSVRAWLAGNDLQTADGRPPASDAVTTARAMMSHPLEDRHARATAILNAARFEVSLGDLGSPDQARQLIDRALADPHNRTSDQLLSAAGLLAQLAARQPAGPARRAEEDRVVALANEAAEAGSRTGQSRIAAAGFFTGGSGGEAIRRPDLAADQAQRAVAEARALGPHSTYIQTLISAANILAGLGRTDEALSIYNEAGQRLAAPNDRVADEDAWALHSLGSTMLQIGLNPQGSGGSRASLISSGLGFLEKARDAAPQASVIRHDLAMAYYALERKIDALREMTYAATIADSNAFLARRLSGLMAEMGMGQEAAEWERKATQREAAASSTPAPVSP